MTEGLSFNSFVILLGVQLYVGLVFLSAWIFGIPSRGRFIPLGFLVVGMIGVVSSAVVAAIQSDWIVFAAQAAMLAALMHVAAAQRASRSGNGARPRLPIVSPQSADPKSGIHPLPTKSGLVPPKGQTLGQRDV